MNDITYCTNSDCGITSCNRHMFGADKTKPNSFANFEDCPYWGLRQEGRRRQMKEADKCCCNCEHCKRVEIKGQIECICEVTGMGIFYVGLFTHRCEKWEEDEWK